MTPDLKRFVPVQLSALFLFGDRLYSAANKSSTLFRRNKRRYANLEQLIGFCCKSTADDPLTFVESESFDRADGQLD